MPSMVQKIKEPSRRNEKGGVFRIVVGSHFGDGPPNCQCETCLKGDTANHKYMSRKNTDSDEYLNDIIVSPKQDLEARFNYGNDSRKFLRIHPSEAEEYVRRLGYNQQLGFTATPTPTATVEKPTKSK